MKVDETCKQIMKHDMRDVGITHTSQCTKPVYRDGYCKKHYTNYRRKKTPWGERRDYRPITLEEMNKGKYFKLRYSHVHKLLRLRQGVIQEYKSNTDTWSDTEREINYELYCVKIY